MINFLTDIPAILIAASLGTLVWRRSSSKQTNQLFASMIILVTFWMSIVLIADAIAIHPPDNILWARLTIVAPLLLLPLLLIFAISFPNPKDTLSQLKRIIIFLPTLLLIPFVPTAFNIVSTTHLSWGGSIVPGPVYFLFDCYFILYLFISIFILARKYRKYQGIIKQQLRYIILGIGATATISIFVSGVLPIFGISQFSILGPPSTIIFLGATTYAIIRHRLLDIRLVVTRSLIYGILLTTVSLALILVTVISAQFFGGSTTSRNTVSIAIAVIIVFGLDPFRNFLSRITDRIFFKAKVDYQQVLRGISETLSFELDLRKLITSVRETLVRELKVKSAATLLRKTGGLGTEKFEALPDMLAINPNLSIRNDSALIAFLRERRHPALLESLERRIDDTPEDKRGPLVASQKEFERMGGALAAPIYAQGHLIAVLVLGPKLSGDTFSNDDLQLMEVLAPQIGSAIQKANLFEEVRQFGESLKVKVEEATAELQERNISLETLQNITKDITRRLDFNQVVQNIADSVANKLGYLGAILVFFDDDGKTVRARAITQTALTKKALEVLPIKFTDYTTDINDSKSTSLGHQVLRTGEITKTESFADVVSPPLPRVLAATIQKLIGIKSIVLIPIVAEGKTIGVIEIGTKKVLKDIDDTELATMQAMADELGIVARNIQLFQQLRVTNDQLGVANDHLKELDQAKSEFVSIASHQLRTPMTGIMGYLSMMTQGDFGKLKPEHQQILTSLLSESQRMIRLINQFLDVSKIEAGKFTYTKKPSQLEDSIDTVVRELTKNATDKKLQLVWKRPAKLLPAAMVDADKMADVILNLIDNAIKYTTEGSITVSAAAEDGSIHVRVKDTGVGIKPGDAGQLFNKFVRGSGIAKIQPGGTGLGLFIAKSVIDSHGGKIWVESEGEGQGSTFQFTVPINPPAGVEPHPLNAAAHVVKPRGTVEKFLGTK